MDRKHAVLIVGAILAAYLFFSLAWISLPGPQFDELLFIAVWYRHSPSTFYITLVQISSLNPTPCALGGL